MRPRAVFDPDPDPDLCDVLPLLKMNSKYSNSSFRVLREETGAFCPCVPPLVVAREPSHSDNPPIVLCHSPSETALDRFLSGRAGMKGPVLPNFLERVAVVFGRPDIRNGREEIEVVVGRPTDVMYGVGRNAKVSSSRLLRSVPNLDDIASGPTPFSYFRRSNTQHVDAQALLPCIPFRRRTQPSAGHNLASPNSFQIRPRASVLQQQENNTQSPLSGRWWKSEIGRAHV